VQFSCWNRTPVSGLVDRGKGWGERRPVRHLLSMVWTELQANSQRERCLGSRTGGIKDAGPKTVADLNLRVDINAPRATVKGVSREERGVAVFDPDSDQTVLALHRGAFCVSVGPHPAIVLEASPALNLNLPGAYTLCSCTGDAWRRASSTIATPPRKRVPRIHNRSILCRAVFNFICQLDGTPTRWYSRVDTCVVEGCRTRKSSGTLSWCVGDSEIHRFHSLVAGSFCFVWTNV
jgi:hypothetical protein